MAHNEDTPLLNSELSKKEKFYQSFKELFKSPRDFWLVLCVKIGGFGGFVLIIIAASIYLTEVLGFSDIETGLIYAGLGLTAFTYSILCGTFPDRFGIRKSLFIANFSGLLAFVLLIFIRERYTQIAIMATLAMLSVAINIPTCKLAIKKYTSIEARSIAYSMFYVVLFGSAAISGVVVDLVLSLGNEDFETFRVMFIVGAVMLCIAIICTYFLRELEFSETGELERNVEPSETSYWKQTRGVFGLKSFWKFAGVTGCMVITRACYYHLEVTLPIYMYRQIEEGAHFGYMIALHELVMLVSIPPLTYLVYFFSNYSLLILGGVICSLAPFALLIEGSYLTVAIFVVGVSFGEAIHSPRLVEYTMEIAPSGSEGLFLSLAASPLMLSFIITGVTAGPLLETYCPEDGEKDCWVIWAYIGGVSFISPFLMLILRKYLEESPRLKN